MTDGHPTDGHPTDEQLSSLLDGAAGFDDAGTERDGDRHEDARHGDRHEDAGHGERHEDGGPKLAEHLAGCAECRARMAVLGAVRDLVRTPVAPVPPHVRAASIAAVLRESDAALADADADADADAGIGAGTGVGAGRPSGPTPIKGRRRPLVLVGSAAAVLILAAAVGVPLALSGRTTSGGSTASTAAEASRGAASGGVASGAPHGGSSLGTSALSKFANAPVTDLGPLDSVEALGAGAASLGLRNSAATPNAAAVPGTAGAAPTVPGSSVGGAFAPLPTSSTISAFERCFSSAVRSAGAGRTVQALATAEFEGTPAFVYVFQTVSAGSTPANSARPFAVATAQTGCRVLGTSSI